MAWLRKRGAAWHCETTVGGKRVAFSTRTDSRREAEKVAHERLAALRGDLDASSLMKGVLLCLDVETPAGANPEHLLLKTLIERTDPAEAARIVERRQRELEERSRSNPKELERAKSGRQDLIRILQGTESSRLALEECWAAFRRAPKRREQDESTIEGKYLPAWNRFKRWADANRHTWMHDIGDPEAEAYMGLLQQEGLSPATRASHRAVLQSMWNVLARAGGISANPWHTVAPPQGEATRREPLTLDELRKLFAVAEGEDRVALAIGLFTGLRLADICALKWKDVDLNAGIISVEPQKTRRHGTYLRLPIAPALGDILVKWKEQGRGPWVLPTYAADNDRHRSFAARRIAQVFERAGIGTETSQKTGKRKRRASAGVAHRLRHSFVSLAAAAGVPRVAITAITGHKSKAVEVYEHSSLDIARKAVEAIPVEVLKLPSTDRKG